MSFNRHADGASVGASAFGNTRPEHRAAHAWERPASVATAIPRQKEDHVKHGTTIRLMTSVALGIGVATTLLSAAHGAESPPDKEKMRTSNVSPAFRGTFDDPCLPGNAGSLTFPLDGSYALVDFFGDGASGSGPAQGPDQHNDDDSAYVPLPFSFDFYGDVYDECWVNNNGNLTFADLSSSFSSSGFPSAGVGPMVAPFWADVDTGNPSNPIGDVWMTFFDSDGDTDLDTLVVTWENVGYYNEQADKLNTFQVAISDGTNPVMGLGNNVCFSYDEMCWTTGSASGGIDGFGGTPATVGINRGDGVDFFQVGRFDQPGEAYDGPGGANDGVDYLDGRDFCFQAGDLNTPPIAAGFPPGNLIQVDACTGQVLAFAAGFLSPEIGQTTTVTVADPDGAQAAGAIIATAPGNPASVSIDWTPDVADAGSYAITFTATDDGDPPASIAVTVVLEVLACPDICGDLDGDLDVDADDYALFILAYGSSVGDPLYNAEADYDSDGSVTMLDYVTWIECYFAYLGG